MFKLVVLCAFLATVAAEPGLFYSSPLAYTSVLAPATTTITKSASSVIHPSPVIYSAPLAYSHFIKKRSPQFFPYYAPTTFVTGASLATPLISTPYVRSSAILPVAAPLPYATHLIKKRSASLLIPTTYASAPLLTSAYAAASPLSAHVYSTPISYSTPITYSTTFAHFIKK